eukprot:TRINITY_DN22672_c0_g1_i1.p1 TRINITY_DN22672_c0_g1~~TRINITY_DN22672_c0_g1_i1.p1  ORF type:complete len:226 (-),score=69.70 TRINITY_DN22672_c0_g1_i1:16-693(-)
MSENDVIEDFDDEDLEDLVINASLDDQADIKKEVSFTESDLLRLFKRVDEAMEARNRRIEVTIIGGAVAVMHWRNRTTTHDVDYVVSSKAFTKEEEVLMDVVQEIAKEDGLQSNWMNGSCMVFKSKASSSKKILWSSETGHFTAYLPDDWVHLFMAKFNRWKDTDKSDSVHILSEIRAQEPEFGRLQVMEFFAEKATLEGKSPLKHIALEDVEREMEERLKFLGL